MLLNCPFCGDCDTSIDTWKNEQGNYLPGCNYCGACINGNDSMEDLIKIWNTRDGQPTKEELIKYKKKLESIIIELNKFTSEE